MGEKPLNRTFRLDDGVVLRQFIMKDAPVIFAAVMASYEHLRTYLHWVTPEFSRMTEIGRAHV